MDNPFHCSGPLAGRDGFFDRTSEIMRVQSRIAAEPPQSVSIVGEPRSGKTSLLMWLCSPESRAEIFQDPGCVALYIDVRASSPADPSAFFGLIDRAWQAAGGCGIPATFDGYHDLVRDLMRDGRRLLLFLDDFGLVTQNRGFPLEFFSFMRSLASNSDVGYVTTSTTDLQKLCYTQDIEESPFFNIFTTVHLTPFKEDDARQLLTGQWARAGEPDGVDLDSLLALAGGSPYLLQLVGSVAYRLQTEGPLDARRLSDEAYREARNFLECLWGEHFPPVQREVLRSVQAGSPIQRRQEYAAESLERRGHLVRNGDERRIRSGLLERFVRECGSGSLWKRLFS